MLEQSVTISSLILVWKVPIKTSIWNSTQHMLIETSTGNDADASKGELLLGYFDSKLV